MNLDIFKILKSGGFDSQRIVYNPYFIEFANTLNKLAKCIDFDKNGHLLILDEKGKLALDVNKFIIEGKVDPKPHPEPEPEPEPESGSGKGSDSGSGEGSGSGEDPRIGQTIELWIYEESNPDVKITTLQTVYNNEVDLSTVKSSGKYATLYSTEVGGAYISTSIKLLVNSNNVNIIDMAKWDGSMRHYTKLYVKFE